MNILININVDMNYNMVGKQYFKTRVQAYFYYLPLFKTIKHSMKHYLR